MDAQRVKQFAHKVQFMKPDNIGFLYPVIDESKCTRCNLCCKVCSFNKNYKKSADEEVEVYAVRHKNIAEIEKSRSGAMFVAITDYIIDKGGIVYGAGYKGHFVVTHKRATCHFTNVTRPSVITLADFLGWEKVNTKFNSDDKGVSLVLINSPKGKEIFNAAIEDLNVVETILQVAMKQNHPLKHPSDISPIRDKFEKEYKNNGFEYVFKKYGKFDKPGIFVEFINKIKWNLRKRVFNKLWEKRK